MEVSLICIKEIKELEKCESFVLDRYVNFFKKGHVYNFDFYFKYIEHEIKDRDTFSYFDEKNDFCFHKDEIDEYFMTLEQWRELQINKILNG
jgi:hypothetical protein